MIINKETRPLLENMDGTKKARSGLKCEIEVSKEIVCPRKWCLLRERDCSKRQFSVLVHPRCYKVTVRTKIDNGTLTRKSLLLKYV